MRSFVLIFHYCLFFNFRIVCRTSPTETGVITEKISIKFSYDTVNSSTPFQFLVSIVVFLELHLLINYYCYYYYSYQI